MARQTGTQTTDAQESRSPMDALMVSNSEGFETAIESQRAVLDGMAEISQEVMSFMSHRFKEDMEVSSTLMACKTPEEAFHVQRQFAETATREYFEEARKVMELAARVAREGWAPVERRAADTMKKANEKTG